MSPPRQVVEDVLRDHVLGFRIRWEVRGEHWVDFEAFEVAAVLDSPVRVLLFERRGWVTSDDVVESIDDANPYASGFVKWDGCTEIESPRHHWCGASYYKKHIALLEYIHRRAHELMDREPEEPW